MGLVRGVLGVCLASVVTFLAGCGGNSDSHASSGPPPPACLAALLASCELQGACSVADVNGDGTVLNRCFAGGVKVVSNKGTECANTDDHVYKRDGSLCFTRSVVGFAGHACEGVTTTWKDGSGTLIATETGASGAAHQMNTITCAASGDETVCTDGVCDWDALSTPSCTDGTCS